MSAFLDFKNPTFRSFAFYCMLLVLKMFMVSIITGQLRLSTKSFLNPEDAMRHGGPEFVRSHPDVDRAVRTHRNDLENILPFILIGFFYVLSAPSPTVAAWHFRLFTAARLMHTVAYLAALKAPTRSLSYTAGLVVSISMAVQVVMTSFQTDRVGNR
ncbi:prostaglandin E synthase-like [Branchiostoma floridae]|uniref:Prostaglandin E synthase n=1 Tax=Branchiostoma floridae TaxID=7739 RepID=A0A9J7LC34_BRAFL|nr:prostaglandin E synthase-like [Branchiostoma floridae]